MSAEEEAEVVKNLVKASGGPGIGFGLMPYQKAFLTASKPLKITVNSQAFEKGLMAMVWKENLRRGRACG